MGKNEKTSPAVGKKASKLLKKSKSANVKSVSASALTQLPDRKKKRRKSK